MKTTLNLVYIIPSFPLLTTTFIDREIQILRRWGVKLDVVAIRRPPASETVSEYQYQLQQEVIYLLPGNWQHIFLAHLYFALLQPLNFFKTLIYLLTRPHPTLKTRWMTLFHFGEGVYTAYLLREKLFHEVHAHFVDRSATIALVVGRLLNTPYSLSIHAGPDIFVNPVLLPEKIMEARHIATCTLYNKTHVEKLIGQDLSHKISYLRHGLDLSLYNPAPAISNRHPLILSVGQLAERKGFIQLIKACRELKDQGYDFTCQIIGQGPQHDELATLIVQLSLNDTVILCGALPHEKVIDRYNQATVFVLPCVMSREGNLDGIPNVLPEAMAMQVPVVTTNISGIPELVEDQINGMVIPSEDEVSLAQVMARLLDDPALREKLGQNGRQSVLERFSIERNVWEFAVTLWPEWFKNWQ